MNKIKQIILNERVLAKGNQYCWVFDSKFNNKEDFIKEFKLYNKGIDSMIVVDFTVFTGDKIIIRYNGSLLENGYDHPLEYIIDLKVNQTISYLNIMYQFNNGAYEHLHDMDHHFFEGLYYEDLHGETLTLSMSLGS